MKKTIKIAIGAFVLGAIIFGSIGVVASTVLVGSIAYQPKNSAWKVSNVEDALNDLYLKKAGDNYSTEEREIGTWIDNKPIYQKTITVTSPSSTSAAKIFEDSDIDFMVSFDGYITHNGSSVLGAQPLNWYYNSSRYVSAWWDNATKALYMICSSSYEQNKGLTITLRYTKVDPEPTNN